MTDYEDLFENVDEPPLTVEDAPRQDPSFFEDDDLYPDEGPWHVRLLIPIDEAENPVAAVEEFIYDITMFGLRSYVYRVTHVNSEQTFLVKDGRVVDEEQVIAELAEEED